MLWCHSNTVSSRLSWSLLILLAALSPFLLWAVIHTNTENSSVHPWFPTDGDSLTTYETFEDAFGGEDIWTLVFEEPLSEEEERLFLDALRKRNSEFDPPLLNGIRKTEELISSLGEAEKQAQRKKLNGILFDKSGERSVFMVQSSSEGFRERTHVYNDILRPAIKAHPRGDEVRISGSGYVGVMADREASRALLQITPMTFLVACVLSWIVLRRLKLAVIAMAAAGLASASSMAVVYYGGQTLSHLLVVIPSLALLLSLSTAVHLLQYYREAVVDGMGSQAWLGALQKGWLPTLAATITTVIGFLALQISSIPTVDDFSKFGAVSVVLTPLVVFAVTIPGLVLLKPKLPKGDWVETSVLPVFQSVVNRGRGWALSLLLLFILLSGFGFPKLKTEVSMETFFAEESEFGRNHQWYREHFGFYHFLQVIGTFDQETPFEEQLGEVLTAHHQLESEELGFRIYSAAVFQSQSGAVRSLSEMEFVREQLSKEKFFVENGDEVLWKLTVYYEPETGREQVEVESEILSVLESESGDLGPWHVTGAYKLFGGAQEVLLGDLLKTFYLACAFILPLIALVLRSASLGLIALIGNLFPVSLLFGGMGLFGLPLDISTMVIGSIAFGVAVDDTMHFMTCLSRSLKRDGELRIAEAIRSAYRNSGGAIIKTTLIISIGLAVFLLSDFLPSRRFAVYTSLVMILAAIGDLVLIPLLIKGPFRKWIAGRK